MKKRTAILLSGTLLASITGYAAWCLRMFYLSPRLEIDASVWPDGREAVAHWAQTPGYAGPFAFDRDKAWWNLGHPWDPALFPVVRAWEDPKSGLWASRGEGLWGFSRSGGKWDSSKVANHAENTMSSVPSAIFWQGEVATRFEAWVAGGVNMEILAIGSWCQLSSTDFDAIRSQPTFQGQPVVARATVLESAERQELLEELSRSIREAGIPVEHRDLSSAYGIILTRDDQKLEFLIHTGGDVGSAFGNGLAVKEVGDCFGVGFRACQAFEEFLDKHGIERSEPATK